MKTSKFKMAELAANATGGEKPHAETAESAEFKMTELGPIPVDWEVKRIIDVAPLQRGFDLPFSHLMEGVVPVVYSNGIGAYHSKGMCKGPGLVTGRSGTIGKFFYIESGDYWPHNTTLWVTDFCGNNPLFVKYLYETLDFEDFSTGTGVPTLNRNSVHEHKVVIPPLAEQRRIAEALSDIDELISALGKLIEKKRNIKQGAIQELLGMRNEECGMRNVPRRRLAGFSGAWVEKRLGEIGDFIAGNGFPLNKQGDKSGDYPFFKVSDFNNTGNENVLRVANNYISESTFKELHCSLIPSGSIVFAKIGAAIALERKRRVCYDSCIDNNMMAFCVNRQNDERFITECLRRVVFADLAESTALPALNVRKLREYKIVVPLSLAEQRAIATVLSDMDAEIAALEAKRTKYESIKQGMMQELLTGKARLKP